MGTGQTLFKQVMLYENWPHFTNNLGNGPNGQFKCSPVSHYVIRDCSPHGAN